MYLLDTDVCIDLLSGTSPALVRQLARRHPSEIVLCAVVKAELLFGARSSARVAANLALLATFFEPFACLPFDDDCAGHYGLIRADLGRSGSPIGPNDLLIAATARTHDLTLVTRNTREFSRVVGLRVEDWSVAER